MKITTNVGLIYVLNQVTSIDGFTFLPNKVIHQSTGSTGYCYGNIGSSKSMSVFGKVFGDAKDFISDKAEKIKERSKRRIEDAEDRIKERVAKRIRMRVEDLAIHKLVGRLDHPARSTVRIFEEIDEVYTALIGTMLPELLIKANDNSMTSDMFTEYDGEGDETERFDTGWTREGSYDWKKGFIPAHYTEVTNDITLKIILKDAFYGTPNPLEDDIVDLSRTDILFPLQDNIVSFKTRQEVEKLLNDTKLNGRKTKGASPDPYDGQDWGDDTASDENFSRFFFHAMGAAMLEQQFEESSRPELGPIEINMDFMKKLAVRKGFRPMGVKIFFDTNQKATAIYDSAKDITFKPGDKEWEGAKFLARSSAFTLLTAREHLFQTHLLVSNYLSLASIKHLPPSHPIKRLVNVFTFRTNTVNGQAFETLIPERAPLHRALGFEYDAMLAIFDNSFQNSNAWEPFPKRNMRPELLEMSANGKLPYHSEAVEYYNIVENLVRSWLSDSGYGATDLYAEAFYDEIRDSSVGQKYEIPEFDGVDSLVDLLTQALFMVTCYHEIIGTVIDYTKDPKFVGFRVLEDTDGKPSTELDAQSFIGEMIIAASTGLKVPMLLKPYKNYFGKDGAPAWERKNWDNFTDALTKQSKKTREDKRKEVQFLYFDPEKFESAVSV